MAPPTDDGPDVEEREAMLEAAILRTLIGESTSLTADELRAEFQEHGDAPGAVEDAIRRLVSTGLAHRASQFVVPSRAALYMDELLID